LLAVCLEAGIPPAAAVGAVADVVGEPVRTHLRRVAGLYRLGSAPAQAWADVPVPLRGLGRAFVRAGDSGSAVVPALRGLAVEVRGEVRSRAEVAVRRAGVWVLAPLGACFLPAFLCLGVVPLVLGIARSVFG
jgi:pilus assembly protein TadC